MKHFEPKEAYEFLKKNPNSVFIDCRSEMEYLFVGHPAGAILVPWNDGPNWDVNPDFVAHVKKAASVDRPIILICRSGNRSLDAARALEDGGIDPSEVGYINAHGTSTPYNDKFETIAIKRVFGEHAARVAVSSTKSMTGHLLGAAGGVEAVFSILALQDQISPPTINLQNPDPRCDLDYVPNVARKMTIRAALSNSFGFGGTNGSVVFKLI